MLRQNILVQSLHSRWDTISLFKPWFMLRQNTPLDQIQSLVPVETKFPSDSNFGSCWAKDPYAPNLGSCWDKLSLFKPWFMFIETKYPRWSKLIHVEQRNHVNQTLVHVETKYHSWSNLGFSWMQKTSADQTLVHVETKYLVETQYRSWSSLGFRWMQKTLVHQTLVRVESRRLFVCQILVQVDYRRPLLLQPINLLLSCRRTLTPFFFLLKLRMCLLCFVWVGIPECTACLFILIGWLVVYVTFLVSHKWTIFS